MAFNISAWLPRHTLRMVPWYHNIIPKWSKCIQMIHSRELTYTRSKAAGKMLFHRWDMLVPRVKQSKMQLKGRRDQHRTPGDKNQRVSFLRNIYIIPVYTCIWYIKSTSIYLYNIQWFLVQPGFIYFLSLKIKLKGAIEICLSKTKTPWKWMVGKTSLTFWVSGATFQGRSC